MASDLVYASQLQRICVGDESSLNCEARRAPIDGDVEYGRGAADTEHTEKRVGIDEASSFIRYGSGNKVTESHLEKWVSL